MESGLLLTLILINTVSYVFTAIYFFEPKRGIFSALVKCFAISFIGLFIAIIVAIKNGR
jgi:hypothetical protein